MNRSKNMGAAVLVALTVHGAFLFGLGRYETPAVAYMVAEEQGVVIDLTPASEQALQTKMQEPQAIIPQPSVFRAKTRQRTRITAASTGSETVSATSPASAPTGAAASSSASDPAPLDILANPKPIYPELARKRGQEGLVELLAEVDERGFLLNLIVKQSSGFSLLDDSALKTVKRWRFRSARRGGEPVRGSVLIPVVFQLQ